MANLFLRKTIQNCKEATLLVLKKQERKLRIFERVRLFIHQCFCKPCKHFEEQSTIIDQSLSEIVTTQSEQPSHVLPEEKKQQIQKMLNKEALFIVNVFLTYML